MAEAKKKQEKEAQLIVEAAPVNKDLKTPNSKEPVTIESNITAAAESAAIEEQVVIEEKRGIADTAKAGKRSAKAQREADEHLAKEARKSNGETGEDTPKQPIKATRSRLERRGKQFRKAAEYIERGKAYNLEDAVKLAKKTSIAKFDATLEIHIRLGVDPRQADQNIRDNLVLPAGTGRKVRVAVFDDTDTPAADIAGVETITKLLDKGQIEFDVLISTPMQMAKLGKYARLLGPRGLMPNPKSGTVTTDITKAVNEAKAGRIEYRVDSTGIVHIGIGKVSFDDSKLLQNVQAVLASLKANKPASVKGIYFRSAYLSTTMGPSIAIDITNVS